MAYVKNHKLEFTMIQSNLSGQPPHPHVVGQQPLHVVGKQPPSQAESSKEAVKENKLASSSETIKNSRLEVDGQINASKEQPSAKETSKVQDVHEAAMAPTRSQTAMFKKQLDEVSKKANALSNPPKSLSAQVASTAKVPNQLSMINLVPPKILSTAASVVDGAAKFAGGYAPESFHTAAETLKPAISILTDGALSGIATLGAYTPLVKAVAGFGKIAEIALERPEDVNLRKEAMAQGKELRSDLENAIRELGSSNPSLKLELEAKMKELDKIIRGMENATPENRKIAMAGAAATLFKAALSDTILSPIATGAAGPIAAAATGHSAYAGIRDNKKDLQSLQSSEETLRQASRQAEMALNDAKRINDPAEIALLELRNKFIEKEKSLNKSEQRDLVADSTWKTAVYIGSAAIVAGGFTTVAAPAVLGAAAISSIFSYAGAGLGVLGTVASFAGLAGGAVHDNISTSWSSWGASLQKSVLPNSLRETQAELIGARETPREKELRELANERNSLKSLLKTVDSKLTGYIDPISYEIIRPEAGSDEYDNLMTERNGIEEKLALNIAKQTRIASKQSELNSERTAIAAEKRELKEKLESIDSQLQGVVGVGFASEQPEVGSAKYNALMQEREDTLVALDLNEAKESGRIKTREEVTTLNAAKRKLLDAKLKVLERDVEQYDLISRAGPATAEGRHFQSEKDAISPQVKDTQDEINFIAYADQLGMSSEDLSKKLQVIMSSSEALKGLGLGETIKGMKSRDIELAILSSITRKIT